MKGLAAGDLIPLSRLSQAELAAMRNSPGAALGSSRYKPSAEDLRHSSEQLRRKEVRLVIFMGG